MATKMILTGDVNLMSVTDPGVPFALVKDEFRTADIVFGNLECCLHQPNSSHSVEHEGFFADPDVAGEALRSAVGVDKSPFQQQLSISPLVVRVPDSADEVESQRSPFLDRVGGSSCEGLFSPAMC